MKKSKSVQLPIPSWAGAVYGVLCIVLIPWTVYLSWVLPTRHVSRHWDASWVGLDIGIIITLLLTAYLAYKRSKWVAMTSTVAGTILLVDAWFDVMSSRAGVEAFEAILLAIVFEIPIALMSFILAYHVLDKNLD